MALKKARNTKSRSKSIAPTCEFIDKDSNLDKDPEYVPITWRKTTSGPQGTRNQSYKVILDIVVASQFVKEDTLIGSPTE